jgi:hypothetical protein
MTDSITVEELDELDLRYAQAGRLDIGKPNLWPRVSRAARRGLTAWRPIETAPKDVGDYLVWVGEAIFAHQCRDGKWWEDGSRIKPTHWLPLPPTPTDDGVTDAYPYTIPGHPGPSEALTMVNSVLDQMNSEQENPQDDAELDDLLDTHSGAAPSPQGDGGYWRPRYRVIDEHAQIIAVTRTKWTAEKLIEGIKADGGLTSKLGSWSIVAEAKE